MSRLLVVGHPCVVPVNQSVYAALARRGWEPTLVVPARWRGAFGAIEPQALPELEGRLVRVPVLLAGRQQRHVYRTRAAALVRRLRPDVLFVEGEGFSVPALQWGTAAARAGVPFGVQAAENLDRALPLPARLIRSRILPRAAFVAARSPAAAALARRWGARGAVGVAPHGVPRWPAAERNGRDGFTVGFAGRLVPEKGVRELLRAARRVDGARLLLVGDGPLREELAGGGAEIEPGVGHGEMARAYARMDVLVLPSRTTPRWAEQFGRVLVEALWCGVPVVGSDSGEIPWVIETTGGGLVVPEGDEAALAAALERLRDDPAERARLAARGREAVERLFGVEAAADALEQLLREAVA